LVLAGRRKRGDHIAEGVPSHVELR
jgi:hypothetical protein